MTLGELYEPRSPVALPDFPAWNLYPESPWNYALCLDDDTLDELQAKWNESCADPPDAANPERLAQNLSDEVEQIELIPYGATMLRITMLPKA